jgi:hypothetical protein
VRTGYSHKNQVANYTGIQMHQDSLDYEVYLLQVAVVVVEPVRFLFTVAQRFGLLQ